LGKTQTSTVPIHPPSIGFNGQCEAAASTSKCSHLAMNFVDSSDQLKNID